MTSVAVIVSWNNRETLLRCLQSLHRAACPAIVVDNGSTDGSLEEIAHAFPSVTLLPQPQNLGFAQGTNVGIREALSRFQPTFILLLNPDAELLPGALPTLEARLRADPTLGAIAPAILNPDGSPQPFAFGSDPSLSYLLRRATRRLLHQAPLHDWGDPAESSPEWLTGACILARSDVFTRDHLFLDESFFLYFEDNDWCRRLRHHRWHLLRLPSARCIHTGGVSLRANPAATHAYRASLRHFYALHYPRSHGLILRFLLPLYSRLSGNRS